MTDRATKQFLTDAGIVRNVIPNEDVYSCSEPDSRGKVRALVNLGGKMVLIEGRRIFDRGSNGD